MNITDLFQQLAAQNIELWFEGERLRFRAPSGALAPELRASLAEHKAALLAELRRQAAASAGEYPLSFGQQALWFLNQSDPASAAYNVAWTGRIRSTVDLAALQAAFQALVDRHAALRTTYPARGGVPVQRVAGYQAVAFEAVAAGDLDEGALYERVRQEYRRPFDLGNGPLLRVHVYSRGPQDHILLVNVHHIAVDGWSLWILLDELRALYLANSGGAAANLPRPPAQYVDFVEWQGNLLAGAQGEALWAYWKEHLAGELPVLNLPGDQPRPPVQTFNGASINFTLSAELTGRLRELAKAEGVTLYMLLLAAFQTLLHRYTGQDDLITGSPVFGRSKAEFAKVVGDFINMIPLRVDFSGDPSFRQALGRVRQTLLGALEHQDYPFPRLVAGLGAGRDASRSPIFQAAFDVQRLHSFGELAELFLPLESERRVDFGGLSIQPYPLPQQEGQFDLSLLLVEVEQVLPGTLKYNTDLFSAETARRMLAHFTRLLEGLSADPGAPLSALPLLSPEELTRLVRDWNRTEAPYPQALSASQLFEAQAARTPEAVAAVGVDGTLTYRQLNARANQLAHALRELGLGPEKLAGVCLERTTDMLVAILGVLKAGGAYVPMDPNFPPQRLAYMVEDADLQVIVTQSHLLDSLPPRNAAQIQMDGDAPRLARQPEGNLPILGSPEDLAYVIFTSGSTGRPKGVQIPRRALTNFLCAMQHQPGLGPEDVLASVTTLSFDIAGLELYLPLISGGRVVIVPAETSTDGAALAELLEQHAASAMQATPATWRLLVETGWRGRPGMKMLCGGEALPIDLAHQLLERGGELWNLYGPTETTIWSTLERVSAPGKGPLSIGRPIANTQAYILDKHCQPVPVGVAGHLYIGGDGLARGYLKRPELTAEQFIPWEGPAGNGPLPAAGSRIYHTGDLARWLPDGRIECLGRGDQQVKLRGFRIELGEIEAVLGEHPAVQQAVAMVREDTPGDKRLVAYLITHPGEAPTARELRGFLRDRLPTYMLPAAYVTLEAFPLTPNGKIDRRALPAPSQSGGETQKTAQAPQSEMEKLIAAIWQKVLQVSQVSVFDNFFDLGGHSLLAMQVVADLQDKTGLRLEPAYLRFESLGQLAVTMEEKKRAVSQ